MSANQTTPLVINVAINGERQKSDNPNVPREPAEIIETALACYKAGAGAIHAHNADFRLTGARAADDYLASWRKVKAAKPDAVRYPTLTLGGTDELEHVRLIDETVGLEFAAIDVCSVAAAQLDAEGLPVGGYYTNGFDQIRSAFAQTGALGIGPQIAIFEPGCLHTVLAYHRAGKLPQGAVVNFYFCGGHGGAFGSRTLGFGLPPTPTALGAYLDLLGDADLPWTVSCWGGDLLTTELPRIAIETGGHVLVGLECHFDPVRKPTNEAQIREVARLAAEAGRPIADCQTALQIWRSPKASA